MREESRAESFRCHRRPQTAVTLSGPSSGCTNRVQLEANVILQIQYSFQAIPTGTHLPPSQSLTLHRCISIQMTNLSNLDKTSRSLGYPRGKSKQITLKPLTNLGNNSISRFKKKKERECFPGSLAVKPPRFQCRERGFHPWLGNEDPIRHAEISRRNQVRTYEEKHFTVPKGNTVQVETTDLLAGTITR